MSRTPRKRQPITSAVKAIAEAADKAGCAGLTFDEFLAAAMWAAKMSNLDVPHPDMTSAAIDRNWASNEWAVVVEKMDEEKAS